MLLIASLNTAALLHNMPLCFRNPDPICVMWLLNAQFYTANFNSHPTPPPPPAPAPRPPKRFFSSEPRFQSSTMYAFPITWDIHVQFHTHKITGKTITLDPQFTFAEPGGRVVQDIGLRLLDSWDNGFRSCWGHGCSSLVLFGFSVGSCFCDELITRSEES